MNTQTDTLIASLDEWPAHARLWIYVGDRELDGREVAYARTVLRNFVTTWTAHQRALRAFSEVVLDRVIILGVDQTMAGASGCSIDNSVHAVRGLGQELGVNFLDRMVFLILDRVKSTTVAYRRDAFAAAYASGEINDATLVIDPLVETVEQARAGLVKPLGASWHSRMV